MDLLGAALRPPAVHERGAASAGTPGLSGVGPPSEGGMRRRREPRPAGTLPLHVPRHRPSAAGSSFTYGEGYPLPSAGSRGGVRPSNTKTVAGHGWLAPSHVSQGGGAGVARPGGASLDKNRPADCLCLASARGTVPGHGVGGCPPPMARWLVERQTRRTTDLGDGRLGADPGLDPHLSLPWAAGRAPAPPCPASAARCPGRGRRSRR